MGDITGRPKAPEPQVVYVPQYVYTSPSTVASQSGGGTGPSQNTSREDGEENLTPDQKREKNLLSRSRSRIGTILTGFRGILAPAETQTQRKTLLGE